jgi:hypothetical protein
VPDQHPHRDGVAAVAGHQVRQVVADRGVESDMALFDLAQHGHGGEGLGDAADAVTHVGGGGGAGVEVGDARGAAEHVVAVADLGERGGDSGPVHRVQGRLDAIGVEWLVHGGSSREALRYF